MLGIFNAVTCVRKGKQFIQRSDFFERDDFFLMVSGTNCIVAVWSTFKKSYFLSWLFFVRFTSIGPTLFDVTVVIISCPFYQR